MPEKIERQLQSQLEQQQAAARGLQNEFNVKSMCEGDCLPKLIASSMTLFDGVVACQPEFKAAGKKTWEKLMSALGNLKMQLNVEASFSVEVSAEVTAEGSGRRRLDEELVHILNESIAETVDSVRRLDAKTGFFSLFKSDCPLDMCGKAFLTDKCVDKDHHNNLKVAISGDLSAMVSAKATAKAERRLGASELAAEAILEAIKKVLDETGITDAMVCFVKPFLNFACEMCADDKCTKNTKIEEFMCPTKDDGWSAVAKVDLGAKAYASWGDDKKEGFKAGGKAAGKAEVAISNPFADVIEQPNMDRATAMLEEMCLYNKVGKFYCMEPKKLKSVFEAMPKEVPDPCSFDCDSDAGKAIKSMGCCMGSFLGVADSFGSFGYEARKAAKMIVLKCGTLATCTQVGGGAETFVAKTKRRFVMAKKAVKNCPVTIEEEKSFKKTTGEELKLSMKYQAKIVITCKAKKCASGRRLEEGAQLDVVVPVSGSAETVDRDAAKVENGMIADGSTGDVVIADAKEDDDVEKDLVKEKAPADEADVNASAVSSSVMLAPALLATVATVATLAA